jgi:DNA-binding FadR family transcriptional regulator
MSEIVAAQLRARIIHGDLADGDELPREMLLVEEFGISRPSLREAIRILETEGLIRIRRGKIGGAVVRRPTAASAAYHLGLALQAKHTTLEDLAKARAVIEPACAGLIAELPARKRAKVVKTLNALVNANEQDLGKASAFTRSALTFHEGIIQNCGNTTVTMLAGALEAMWSFQERTWAENATNEGEYPNPKYQREVLRAHRRIIKLISDGDEVGATHAMRAHLESSQPYVNYPNALLDALGNHA